MSAEFELPPRKYLADPALAGPPTYTRSDLEAVAREAASKCVFCIKNFDADRVNKHAAEVVTRYLEREK